MAAKPEFAHLHIHTEYSLLDGACRVKELVERIKTLGMDSVAVTDHGSLSAGLTLQNAADKAGIRAIQGLEAYFTEDRRVRDPKNRYYHLTLLAETDEGYLNLCRMNYHAAREGLYYGKPRVDYELLTRYGKGVIVLSGCMGGRFMQELIDPGREPSQRQREHNARDELLRLADCVGRENVYVEVQNAGVEDYGSSQWNWNAQADRIARDLGLLTVASADTHYLWADPSKGPRFGDVAHHDALLCVQTKNLIHVPPKDRFSLVHDWNQPHYYHLRTVQEMREYLANVEDSIANSLIVAERCQGRIQTGRTFEMLPAFPVPEDFTVARECPEGMDPKIWRQQEYLRDWVYRGLHERYGDPLPAEVVERTEYELGVINDMGVNDYFCIVADVNDYARTIGIVTGPGRGSGAGSIVCYAMGITQLDPLEHRLLFERFLAPTRISMPDIDLDYSHGHDMLRKYLSEKYGEENCAQIITFQTIGGKAGIRAAGRIRGDELRPLADKMAKAVTMKGAVPASLTESLDREGPFFSPELSKIVTGSKEAQAIIDDAKWMEGLISAESVHPAAYVVAPFPLIDALPVTVTKDGENVTAFAMSQAEDVGALKLDLLALRNLGILADAERLIKKTKGDDVPASLYQVPKADAKTFDMLARGDSIGVFQLESGGMQDTLRTVGVSEFNDLVAIVAAYRPGAMEQIPAYARRKKGIEPVTYGDPRMEPILSETYGLCLYQEQAMLLARDLAGFTGQLMDVLRKAIGKKKLDVMESLKPMFFDGGSDTNNRTGEVTEVPGCVKNGVPRPIAEWVWSVFVASADYSFNKSHAAAYALISYVTAYLKANYPTEYMAALLTSVMGTKDKVPFYLYETRRMGIEVLPPSVQESFSEFEPTGENQVRFGLTAIKGVGEGIVQAVVTEREANGPFRNLWDFCQRVEGVNRRELDHLIKAGAFDWTGHSRAGLLQVTETALKKAKKVREKKAQGQDSLFDFGGSFEAELGAITVDDEPKVPELWFSEDEKFALEREVCGLYVSGHPLEHARAAWERVRHVGLGELDEEHLSDDADEPTTLTVAGIVTHKRVIYTKAKNERMIIVTLEDLTGQAEMVAFPRTVKEGVEDHLGEGDWAWVRITVKEDTRGFGSDDEDGKKQLQLIINTAGRFDPDTIELPEFYDVQLPRHVVTPELMKTIRSVLDEHPGDTKVRLLLVDHDGTPTKTYMMQDGGVTPSQKLTDALKTAVAGR